MSGGRGVGKRPREVKPTQRVCDYGSEKRRSYKKDEVCNALTWYLDLQCEEDQNYLLNLKLGRLLETWVRTIAVR